VVDTVSTTLRSNIFSARFLPRTNDYKIVACAGDGTVLYTDLRRKPETASCLFNCHSSTVYDVVTVPQDPNTFLTCGEDATVRWFDLRVKTQCNKQGCDEDVLIDTRRAASALAVDPSFPHHLAVGTADSCVKIYDRRTLATRRGGGQGSGESLLSKPNPVLNSNMTMDTNMKKFLAN
jgi:nuclear receptor interaction protein